METYSSELEQLPAAQLLFQEHEFS
jgi:hypothetical protein